VSEDVIAAVLLLHERSVDEIAPHLNATELEQTIVLVGRSPRLYPRGTVEALENKRVVLAPPATSVKPSSVTREKAARTSTFDRSNTAGAGDPSRARARQNPQGPEVEALENKRVVLAPPATSVKPSSVTREKAARTSTFDRSNTAGAGDPSRARARQNPQGPESAKKPGTRPGTLTETIRRRFEVAELLHLGLSVRAMSMATGIPPTSVHRAKRAIARAEAKQELAVLKIIDRLSRKAFSRPTKHGTET
jgi:hypothetical protein